MLETPRPAGDSTGVEVADLAGLGTLLTCFFPPVITTLSPRYSP